MSFISLKLLNKAIFISKHIKFSFFEYKDVFSKSAKYLIIFLEIFSLSFILFNLTRILYPIVINFLIPLLLFCLLYIAIIFSDILLHEISNFYYIIF